MRLTATSAIACVVLLLSADAVAGQDALIDAVRARNRTAVTALLRKGAPVNQPQSDGTTALHWAAHVNDVELADALLRAGANPNASNRYGIPPLSLACENGNAQMIQRLIAAGADVHVKITGEPLAMTAARAANVDAVKTLLAAGADINARDSWRGQTALMWAAAENHAEIVRVLVANGADVTARSTAGYTALRFAARQGSMESARALVDAGADVNEVHPAGTSVLSTAIVNLKYALAGFLVSRGARAAATDKSGSTPLHEIVTARNRSTGGLGTRATRRVPSGGLGSMDLMAHLVIAGADVNARRAPQGRPGQQATLTDGGVNLGGATPFLLAAKASDVEAMRFLLANGADPGLPTLGKTTPLMVAAGIGHTADDVGMKTEQEVIVALQLVLAAGADINAANEHGQTVLHGAVYRSMNGVIQFLVDKGARLDPRDARGRTPLQLATDGFDADGHHRRDKQAALLRELATRTQ